MSLSIGPALLIAAGVVIVSLALFRWVARRSSTPCPAWLTVLLENPYMEAVAGSQLLLDRARVGTGMNVLDVGSGPGRLAVPAAQRVSPTGHVVALDLQPAMMRKLKERAADLGVTNLETIVGGAGEGHLPRGVFDRAFLVTVLGEIVRQETALREIFEALEPEGLLSITEVIPDPHYQSRRRVRRLAESVGFEYRETLGPWFAFTMNFSRPVNETRRQEDERKDNTSARSRGDERD